MNQPTLFQCPVCNQSLTKADKVFRCAQGHTYDIARQGYVNLLLPQHTGQGNPGDTIEMLRSRQAFLNKGYYQEFSDQVNATVLSALPVDRPITLLDAGCGEGYYTSRLRQALAAAGREAELCGVDVAKRAVQYAAGRDKAIRFAVASTYHLPILDKSMDLVLCIFAPRDEGEFARVLKEAGRLIVAAPGPRHLRSLREIIYSEPEDIGSRGDVGGSFALLDRANATYPLSIDTNQDILNLLTMTPYSKHVDGVALSKLKELTGLETEIDVNIFVYGLG